MISNKPKYYETSCEEVYIRSYVCAGVRLYDVYEREYIHPVEKELKSLSEARRIANSYIKDNF